MACYGEELHDWVAKMEWHETEQIADLGWCAPMEEFGQIVGQEPSEMGEKEPENEMDGKSETERQNLSVKEAQSEKGCLHEVIQEMGELLTKVPEEKV